MLNWNVLTPLSLGGGRGWIHGASWVDPELSAPLCEVSQHQCVTAVPLDPVHWLIFAASLTFVKVTAHDHVIRTTRKSRAASSQRSTRTFT